MFDLCFCVAVPCESGYWKFEKWKVKWKSGSLISRSEKWNENLVHSFREWKVKWKCLDIEIESEKWNENVSKSRSRVKSELKMPRDRDREVKFLENFREILENQEIKKISNFVTNAFHLANVYSGIQQNAISESICHRGFWGWSLVETCKAVWMDWVGNLWMHLCWRRTRMADIDSDLLTIK